ncbi:DUF6600 domain-containing protein [Pandoraea terrigena]|uniref:Prolin-rich exported protein n=1 Tax=Pandoraea terrigena TaxID=2508292 RepID=A0A5E4T3B7_9BURK|nr:DUF6600 domain-containing protein [Pandoraea terrigena]VVD81752.1 Putative prolin-rich exported protein [Pandoraea terrigena]
MKSLISWQTMVRCLGVGLALGALGAAGLPALAQAPSADPPGRVARLNEFDGTVTYAPAGTNDWRYADRNRPLTTGDAIWVERNSRAEMHVGGTAVRMGPSTSVVLSAVTDQNVQLNVTQGTVGLRLRAFDPNQPYEIDTPNLAFVPQQAGEYRVDVDPNGATTVSVWRGAATVYGQGASVPLQQGQRAAFVGQNLAQQPAGPFVADAFDQWVHQRDAREDASVAARYVSRDVTGFESLDDYGAWQETPSYGAVWVPSDVPAGWAPYRTGHWAWVDPWGWTWVDDAPWGFAPYHYGRWAYVDARWCWVPGPVAVRPVYAPALVGWVSGNSGGNAWGIAFAAGGAGLAWFALGPHDAYRPAYHASPSYVTNINRSTVIRTTNVTNINVNNVYVNRNVRGAVSTMPAQAFVQGRRVGAPVALATPHAGQPWRVGNTPGVAPVRQSVFGNSRPAAGAPPAGVFNRQVLATRAPVGRAMPSRELTSTLHTVPNAGGAPLVFDQNAQQRQNGRPTGPNPQGHVQPRVTVVGTHGPAGAPIGGEGAAPAQPPLKAMGATGAQAAHGGLPPTHTVPPTQGAPGRSRVPGEPAVPGVPGEPGVPGVPGRSVYQNRPGQSGPQGQPPVRSEQAVPFGVPHPPQMARPQPRPEPQVERPQIAPRPQPQVERPQVAPRPQPQVERPQVAPRPQPQVERPQVTPRPQPQVERPQVAPRPQPQVERPQVAPRPQPQPGRPQAPPRPQPQAVPHPQPKEPPQPAPRERKPEGAQAPAHDVEHPAASSRRPSREGEPPSG